jgi:hypothetical protein
MGHRVTSDCASAVAAHRLTAGWNCNEILWNILVCIVHRAHNHAGKVYARRHEGDSWPGAGLRSTCREKVMD